MTEIESLPIHIINAVFKTLDDKACPICTEQITDKTVTATKCGHFYCSMCILRWCEVHYTCPMCSTLIVLSESDSDSDIDSNSDSDIDSNGDSISESDSESDSDSISESDSESDSDSNNYSNSESDNESNINNNTDILNDFSYVIIPSLVLLMLLSLSDSLFE